jgi:N-formylglutamate amidohydrolase
MEDAGRRSEEEPERLLQGEVGLDEEAEFPFVFEPAKRITPLVISFPHVGLEWPAALGPRPQVNFPRNADYEVHRLYHRASTMGAARIRARYTRLVVDLNRASNDVRPEVVPDHPSPSPQPHLTGGKGERGRAIRNRGVIWRTAVGNIPLFDQLPFASFELRLRDYYWPYHRALEALLERRRRRFGYAILLDAHSMPGSVGEDLVLGTRNSDAAAEIVQNRAVRALSSTPDSAAQLRVGVDEPYRGGELVRAFGRPNAGLHALQLEISRALYMDEYRLDLWPLPKPRSSQSAPAGARGAVRPRLAELLQRVESLVETLAEPIPELTRPS